ncbi:sensor histidine kinase [Streptomonospora algeriensis]
MAMFPRVRSWSLRTRSTARTVLAAAILLALAITATSLLARAAIQREQVLIAGEAAREVALDIQNDRVDGLIDPRGGVVRIQAVAPGGEVVAASRALAGERALTGLRPEGDDGRIRDVVCGSGPIGCLTVVGYASPDSVYGDVAVYAAIPRSLLLTGPLLEIALIGLGVAALAVIGGIVWVQTGRTLRPVEEVRAGLEQITASNPYQRLPVPDSDDEITALVRAANETLSRLASALDRQRRFAADASHELRTPLAGLRAWIEVEHADLVHGDPVVGLRGALNDTLRLERIVTDLLELARLDADVAVGRAPVDLGDLAAGEVERRQGSLRMDSRIERGTYVYGNRLQLSRLLANLLANAERHASERVLVSVTREEGDEERGEVRQSLRAVLRVHDDGHGVPGPERERIFDRFARLDESRERDPGGSGLGLAISQETARAMGGTLDVDDSDALGGAVFTLRLPLYRSVDHGPDRR